MCLDTNDVDRCTKTKKNLFLSQTNFWYSQILTPSLPFYITKNCMVVKGMCIILRSMYLIWVGKQDSSFTPMFFSTSKLLRLMSGGFCPWNPKFRYCFPKWLHNLTPPQLRWMTGYCIWYQHTLYHHSTIPVIYFSIYNVFHFVLHVVSTPCKSFKIPQNTKVLVPFGSYYYSNIFWCSKLGLIPIFDIVLTFLYGYLFAWRCVVLDKIQTLASTAS